MAMTVRQAKPTYVATLALGNIEVLHRVSQLVDHLCYKASVSYKKIRLKRERWIDEMKTLVTKTTHTKLALLPSLR